MAESGRDVARRPTLDRRRARTTELGAPSRNPHEFQSNSRDLGAVRGAGRGRIVRADRHAPRPRSPGAGVDDVPRGRLRQAPRPPRRSSKGRRAGCEATCRTGRRGGRSLRRKRGRPRRARRDRRDFMREKQVDSRVRRALLPALRPAPTTARWRASPRPPTSRGRSRRRSVGARRRRSRPVRRAPRVSDVTRIEGDELAWEASTTRARSASRARRRASKIARMRRKNRAIRDRCAGAFALCFAARRAPRPPSGCALGRSSRDPRCDSRCDSTSS